MNKEQVEAILRAPSLPYTVHELAWLSPCDVPFDAKHVLEDDFDFEGITAAGTHHKQLDRALDEKLCEQGIAHRLYSAGGCSLCKKCTYPDAPCRFPDRVHRSMEACGIDVGALAKKCGLRYNNGAQTVTYFSMIVFP